MRFFGSMRSVFGLCVFGVVFVLVLLFAVLFGGVLGWFVAFVALGWLVLFGVVVVLFYRAAGFVRQQVGGGFSGDVVVRVEHDLLVIQTQARLGLEGEVGDSVRVPLETILVTSSGLLDLLGERGSGGEKVVFEGEVVE